MDYIVWKEEYSVGYPAIDAQHKNLIALINDLRVSIYDKTATVGIKRIITELTGYIDEHFKTEEILFEQFNYSETEDHVKEHNYFITSVCELFRLYQDNPETLSVNISDFLQDWLIHHILQSDMKFKGKLNK